MKTREQPHGSIADDKSDTLARCKPSDFDGHTAFLSLTPEQRLDALGQMIATIVEFKGKAILSNSSKRMAHKS